VSESLEEYFRRRLAAGLVRQSLTTCSRWAETCRVMKDDANLVQWSHDRFPWLREMADSKAEENAARKGAQLGVSEMLLNIGMFNNDILGRDVLYVLPNQNPDASQFSAARFDPAIEFSPHLSRLYSDVKNVGHKRAGRANFYIRGSQSRAGLKSIPVAVVILDELEEMNQHHVPLAKERLSGQKEKLLWMASTPVLSNMGIDKEYKEGSQEHFFFTCPSCGKLTELLFPDCLEVIGDDPDSHLVMNSYLKCKECKNKLIHENKSSWLKTGKWVASVPEKAKRSFYINQMYSTTIKPGHIAASYLRSKVSEADEQEFHNSKMGEPHEVAGARITDDMINKAKGSYSRKVNRSGNKIITMGIDVGRKCHYEVAEWTLNAYKGNDIHSTAHPKIIDAGGIQVGPEMSELDDLMREFRVLSCVIDAHPDRRAAYMFSQRFMGYVRMCVYIVGLSGKQVQEDKNTNEPIIKVDRTSWLDQALGRFRKGQITIPNNIDYEYSEHLKNIVRVPTKDAQGNPINSYVTAHNKADHHAHARNYNEIALVFAANMQENEDFSEKIF
jgi:hypothetical protein